MISTEVQAVIRASSVCAQQMGDTSLTQAANGKGDAEPRSRLPYFPGMEGSHAHEEQEEDDSCWD
jgi:hypothetical protein